MPSSSGVPTSTAPLLSSSVQILPIQTLQPEFFERAWASIPHPTLPLIATAHAKSITVFSLSTLSSHSVATKGHGRSVRTVAWRPGLPPDRLCMVSGSFDATAAIWRWEGERLEKEITLNNVGGGGDDGADNDEDECDWEFTMVLDGHETEIKSCAFSPSGDLLATCSRDSSIWIWQDYGDEEEDEWETVATLTDHEGDVKTVAWCPDVPGRNRVGRKLYSAHVLASSGYDNTARVWRQDHTSDWVCVSVLEGHEGIVWGLQWEPKPKDKLFPRIMTCSSDATIRVWTRHEDADGGNGTDEDEEAEDDSANGGMKTASWDQLGGIPNTMRKPLREQWECTAVLPKAHDGQIYSISWSADTGNVASTGSDGLMVLYKESEERDGQAEDCSGDHKPASPSWSVLTKMPLAHGSYEVNHVTWCRRYDSGSTRKGEEEMLVTSGDDGLVKAWEVKTI
ncbi:putative cytosolic iron-sulfur protein assembly protein 1 [Escovopsis weberi]|uniref:Probable cytosolic iron-sulfur protein assembly protein 1 n=1 Tax=Escovopsis weberi TaxID=150374 RepID=A0A0M8MVT2_ESCWE|nr:putative cytosolic iron-sulfur protein assembly protein 1 [Escovopsis weberi]